MRGKEREVKALEKEGEQNLHKLLKNNFLVKWFERKRSRVLAPFNQPMTLKSGKKKALTWFFIGSKLEAGFRQYHEYYARSNILISASPYLSQPQK